MRDSRVVALCVGKQVGWDDDDDSCVRHSNKFGLRIVTDTNDRTGRDKYLHIPERREGIATHFDAASVYHEGINRKEFDDAGK